MKKYVFTSHKAYFTRLFLISAAPALKHLLVKLLLGGRMLSVPNTMVDESIRHVLLLMEMTRVIVRIDISIAITQFFHE